MRGTDAGSRAAAIVRDLTVAGWLLLGGSFGFIAFDLERVRAVSAQGAPFGGVWDQRIEVLSFLMLPPNLVVLVPAAAAAAIATWLAGDDLGPWLRTLLRVVTAIAAVYALIGVVSVGNIYANDNDDLEGAFLRLGGTSMALGIVWLCRAAGRAAR